MTTAIVTTAADGRSTDNSLTQWHFQLVDGALCFCWLETVGGKQYLRRALSTDSGATWTRYDPIFTLNVATYTDANGLTQGSGLAGLMLCPAYKDAGVDASYIVGLNVMPKTAGVATYPASQMIQMVYSATTKRFTDYTAGYTFTSQPDILSQNFGNTAAVAFQEATPGYCHFAFIAQDASARYVYLVNLQIAPGNAAPTKIAETRFQSGATNTNYVGLGIKQGATANLYVVYQREATANLYMSLYTSAGAAYALSGAEEVVATGYSTTQVPFTGCVYNPVAGQPDIFYITISGGAGMLKAVRRNGVGAYAAAVTIIASGLPIDVNNPDQGAYNSIAFFPTLNANDDIWVFYKDTTTYQYGELYWVRRNNAVWGAKTLFSGGSPAGRAAPNAGLPMSFHSLTPNRCRIVFSAGSQDAQRGLIVGTTGIPITGNPSPRPSWIIAYDFFEIGVPDAPTNVQPSTAGVSTLTPTITATYNQQRAGDNLGKYRVQVTIHGGASVWDTGAGGTAWGGAAIAPGGTFSIVYAGTALVVGTQYDLQVTFWDTAESYVGAASAVVLFTPNLPPSKVAVALNGDPTTGKQKTALYPLAPVAASTIAPLTASLNRRLSALGAVVAGAYSALASALAFTAPTTQTGFTAYRQAPNLGLARNLAPNGGFIHGSHGFTLDSHGGVVTDATSVTGYAMRLVATGASQNSWVDIPVEAGKGYSIAGQIRSDGTMSAWLDLRWMDASGTQITETPTTLVTSTAWTEVSLANQVAPGNARTIRLEMRNLIAGVGFYTAIRVMQQTTAPAAWTAAHQQYITRGLAVYEASTNLAADGDEEAVGTASYTAVNATLTKDTVTFFAGAKSLKVASTGVDGRAVQNGALAAGQAITISVRAKGGDANCRLDVISTPSNVAIGPQSMNNPNTTDWNALRVSGVIAGGDTGYSIRLVAGANTVVANFDNFAIENKSYDTMNADPSGQAFALAARTVSDLRLAIPTAFNLSDFAAIVVMRTDHTSPSGHFRRVIEFQVDSNNFVAVYIDPTGPTIAVQKDRATVVSGVNDGAVTAFVAGDTVAIGLRFSTAAGLKLWVSKNGGAVATYSSATPEALVPVSGAVARLNLGATNLASQELDGTIGVVRVLQAGLADATISALVLNPYQQPTDNDLAVWQFEGFTSQVPMYDDRLVALATSYDYRADATAAAATPTTNTGEIVSGTVAVANPAAWFLKDSLDATKDTKLNVMTQFPYAVPRETFVATPLSGTRKVGIKQEAPTGMEGSLQMLFTNTADQVAKEAAIRALQASNGDLYLQTPFSQLLKVVLPNPIQFSMHDVRLDASLDLVEVA